MSTDATAAQEKVNDQYPGEKLSLTYLGKSRTWAATINNPYPARSLYQWRKRIVRTAISLDLGGSRTDVTEDDCVVAEATAHIVEAFRALGSLKEFRSLFSEYESLDLAIRGICLTLVALDECSTEVWRVQQPGKVVCLSSSAPGTQGSARGSNALSCRRESMFSFWKTLRR